MPAVAVSVNCCVGKEAGAVGGDRSCGSTIALQARLLFLLLLLLLKLLKLLLLVWMLLVCWLLLHWVDNLLLLLLL
jgi:hypothetical protein